MAEAEEIKNFMIENLKKQGFNSESKGRKLPFEILKQDFDIETGMLHVEARKKLKNEQEIRQLVKKLCDIVEAITAEELHSEVCNLINNVETDGEKVTIQMPTSRQGLMEHALKNILKRKYKGE